MIDLDAIKARLAAATRGAVRRSDAYKRADYLPNTAYEGWMYDGAKVTYFRCKVVIESMELQ